MASDGDNHVETIQQKVTEGWTHLNTIWNQFGYDEEKLAKRRRDVVKHVSELIQDMCNEADERLSEQQTKLDDLMKEILQLAKDLSIDQVPELAVAAGKPLLELEIIFKEIANDLGKRKAIRMEKYNDINEQVIKVADEIGETPMKIEFEGIPADSQVAKLDQHLSHLRHEKAQRFQLYLMYRMAICELFELLEKMPRSELEQLLLEPDLIDLNNPVSATGIKALSKKILDKLHELNNNLKKQLQANKEQGDMYWQKIQDLWLRLSEDEEIILAFTKVHQPISTNTWEAVYKPSVVKGLQNELERLEEEKRRNLSLFIQKVREELCKLWLSQCFMATVQERFTEQNYTDITPFAITDFNSDLYTEELLEKHENEVQYWKDFVDRNKKIIDMVNKRSSMFAQYKTLDQKSDDPSRLANRGGALLKEQKERTKLEKTIPKLEGELKQLCEEFESSIDGGHGMTKFLVYGRTVQQMIEQDWEVFHDEKRIRKEAKKKPNDGANKTLMTTQVGNPGNSRKRPATPSSSRSTPKRNKTQTLIMTPGRVVASPFVHPSTASSSTKKLFANSPRSENQKTTQSKLNSSQIPRVSRKQNISATQAASRKVLRKSIGKLRNASMISFDGSSSSSGGNLQSTSLSQPNLKLGSLDQLNFSKVIRGPILEVLQERKMPKQTSSKENFAHPSSTGKIGKKPISKATTSTMSRAPSVPRIPLPTKLTGKEQIPPKMSKDAIISPVTSYSEFTDHLLCQSTLNSSAFVPIVTQSKPTTPTKATPGMSFTPAKLPLSDNRF